MLQFGIFYILCHLTYESHFVQKNDFFILLELVPKS